MRGDERTTEHFKFVDSEAEDGYMRNNIVKRVD